MPPRPDLRFERALGGRVAGVDEVGYSPIAGPVVAAAVVLPPFRRRPRELRGLTDSKLLSAGDRERLARALSSIAAIGIGAASVGEIDRLNVRRADLLAMRRAIAALPEPPDAVLVDGTALPDVACPAQALIGGDRRSLSIAAASVVAKVTRDRLMRRLALRHPGYAWETNVGYGTDAHVMGILRHGPTPHHRRSFVPLSTVFAGARPIVHAVACAEPVDARSLVLLPLRDDLFGVLDDRDRHHGLLKWTGRRWVLRAVGYAGDGAVLPGGGPLAGHHGVALRAPTIPALRLALARAAAS